MSDKNIIRENVMATIQAALDENIINESDLRNMSINYKEGKEYEPEYIRAEMEQWYRNLGIEALIGRSFTLSLPYWTKTEIQEAAKNDEIIVCVPKGINRTILGKLFHFESWALEDSLITDTTEIEDFWFKTKISYEPERSDCTGRELTKVYIREEKLGMSLERYMVFSFRMYYLHHRFPDLKTKTWLLHGRYEKKAILIAGFDLEKKFSVHAWLSHFHSPKVGGRYVKIPDHLYV